MDPLLLSTLKYLFNDEQVTQFELSYELCSRFGMDFNEEAMLNEILLMEQYSSTQLHDALYGLIQATLDTLLEYHLIELSSEATIRQKNSIIEAIWTLQNLEEPELLLMWLNSDLDDEEQWGECIQYTSDISVDDAIMLLESDPAPFLKRLKKLLSQQEPEFLPNNQDEAQLAKFKSFLAFLKDDTCIAKKYLDQGIPFGIEVEDYWPYYTDVVYDRNQTYEMARDFYSLCLISCNRSREPLKAFHEDSGFLFEDLILIQQIESQLIQLVQNFETHLASHAVPLPGVSHDQT